MAIAKGVQSKTRLRREPWKGEESLLAKYSDPSLCSG